MEDFDEILGSATALVGRDYFQLPIVGGDQIYRERVYCYELYHQMRSYWPHDAHFTLSGEVDKSGHPKLQNYREKPDFLIHVPGNMEGNYLIMEVKKAEIATDGVQKDVRTLSKFIRGASYSRGILLFYGHIDQSVLLGAIEEAIDPGTVLAPIEIWLHSAVGERAVKIETLLPPQTAIPAT